MYKKQIEELKANHEKALKEQINQLEQFSKQVTDLADRNMVNLDLNGW